MSVLIESSAHQLPRNWALASLVVRVLVAAFFTFMAAKSLSGDASMAADWERWGYSGGFRQTIAVLQLIGAIGLLIPATMFGAGLLLAGVLLGAVGTHLLNDPPATLLSPAVFLVLVLVSVFPYRPALLR